MQRISREPTLIRMKKSNLAILVLFVLTICLSADEKAYTEDGKTVLLKDDGTWEYVEEEQPSEYDFRKVTWGMSRDGVTETEEGRPVGEEGGYVFYETSIAGLSCYLMYGFTNDRLSNTGYIFTVSHSNKNDYIDDFYTLEGLLEKKYSRAEPSSTGTPKPSRLNPSAYQKTSQTWKNSLYKDDPEEWGFAVSIGHLAYIARWETERTNIGLNLTGDNYEITLAVRYEGKSLAESYRETQEESTLDDL